MSQFKCLIESQMAIPSRHQMSHTLIAYKFCKLQDRVVCPRCALKYDLVSVDSLALYPSNIIPFSQDCEDCGTTIVDGISLVFHCSQEQGAK